MEVTPFLIPANKGKDKLFKFQYLEEILYNETGIHINVFQYILAMPQATKLRLLRVSNSFNVILQIIPKFHQ
jgi:hypothetical protein